MKPIKTFNINICRTEPEQVLKNKNDIEELKNKEASDVSLVNEKIDTINNKLAVDEENISKNADNIASNSYEISVLKPKVNKNINDIKVNSQAIIELNSKLEATNNNVATNTEGISKLNSDNIQIKKDINQANADIRNVEDEASATALQMENILNGNVIVPKADTATNASNLQYSILDSSSTNEDVQLAYDNFTNKKIPIYFNSYDETLLPCVYANKTTLLFCDAYSLEAENPIKESECVSAYYRFLKSNKWTFSQVNVALGMTIQDSKMIYTGFQANYGIEVHLNLQSKGLSDYDLQPIDLLLSLNQFKSKFLSLNTTFINGFVIVNGTGFFPILNVEFSSTGTFKVSYTENGNYKVISDLIKDDMLAIESFNYFPSF